MQQLFVSYSREDRSRVEPMVGMLRAAGFEVFWDQSLPAGVEWAEFLDAKLITAHCLLVLWTPFSVASRWVRTEANEALQQDKLLPVLLDDVRQPLAFRQIQCFDLIGWDGDLDDPRLARLAEELRARDGTTPPGRTNDNPPPPRPDPPWLRWALIAVMALAVGLGLFWAPLKSGKPDPVAPVAASGAPAPTGPASVAPAPAPAASQLPSTPASPASRASSPSASPPPPAAASSPKPVGNEPPPSADTLRCQRINFQRSLNLPVTADDLAFLKRGCKS